MGLTHPYADPDKGRSQNRCYLAVCLNSSALACSVVAQTLTFLACLSYILEVTFSVVKATPQLQDLRQESGKEPWTGMATKLGYRWQSNHLLGVVISSEAAGPLLVLWNVRGALWSLDSPG